MFIKKQKGAANLLAFTLYLLVSLVILGIIIFSVQQTIQRNQERYNFNEMIQNIDLISNTIDEVSKSRFSSRVIEIYNPSFIEIDCENNYIKGEITYNQELRDDTLIFIKDIEVTKDLGKVIFTKIISYDEDVTLNCNYTSFLLGKHRYVFKYEDYNTDEQNINLLIERIDVNKTID
jgi:hypothetical protein